MKINVHDKGYVRISAVHGNEVDVVNAARCSYNKESTLIDGDLADADKRLLNFLIREGHWSPFRHVHINYEIYAPLLVCRQWLKHVVGASSVEEGMSHNEVSRRYVSDDLEFYIPHADEWRSAPANSKQGSGEPLPAIADESWDGFLLDQVVTLGAVDQNQYGNTWTDRLKHVVNIGLKNYNEALDAGIAPEQARLFLPANGMYVRWRWSASLDATLHFLRLRKASDSQYEIRQYANALEELTRPHFPHTFTAVFGDV